MAAFRILGRIQHRGPNEFLVMAAARPEESTAELVGKGVKWEAVTSQEAATAMLDKLIVEMKAWVHARGDQVVGTDFEYPPEARTKLDEMLLDLQEALKAARLSAQSSEHSARFAMIAAIVSVVGIVVMVIRQFYR